MSTGRWDDLDYAVIDVEGNGNRPPDLVELAVVPIRRGRIGEARTWLVKPSAPIQWYARNIHGISNDDVADAPTIHDVTHEIRTTLGSLVPVGHNVHIDLDVVMRALPGWVPAEAFDTLKLARRAWNLPTYRLGELVAHRHLDADLPDGLRPHRAGYDALVTARLFLDLVTSADVDGMPLADLRAHGIAAGFRTHLTAVPGLFNLP